MIIASGAAFFYGIDTDRLATHPINIKIQNGLGRVTALWTAALDHDQITSSVRTSGSRLECKAVEQLEDRRCRRVTQGHDRDAVSSFRGIAGAARDAAALGLARGNDPVSAAVGHEHGTTYAQRIFEYENKVGFRTGLPDAIVTVP